MFELGKFHFKAKTVAFIKEMYQYAFKKDWILYNKGFSYFVKQKIVCEF